MYSTSNIHLDGCTAEHLSSFPLDFVSTNVDTSHASVTSRNDQINIGTSDYYCRVKTGPGLTDCPPVLLKSTRDGPSKGRSSLANSSLGHQAKRARVENIIRGMISSPGMCDTSVTTYPYEPAGHVREYGKTQDLPSHQEHIESSRSVSKNHSQTRKQPESQQQPLRQLRTKVDHEERESCNYSKKETYSSWSASTGNPTEDSFTDWSEFDSQKYQCWKKLKLMNYFQSRPERVKLLADVLKYELSRAVNRSVDCVFKNVPLLQTSTITECIQTDKPACGDKITRLSCCRNAKVQVPGIQTEALSLVVEKQRLETSSHLLMQPRSAAEQSKPLKRSSLDSTLTTNQLSEKSPDTNQPLRCSEDAPAKCDTLDALWTSVKVKSKVNSKHVSIPQNCTMSEDAEPPGSLCLPRIKIESESLKTNLYLLNEGLTTNHLKKAKLMFFYTRYPSSLVLRMCFPDVQFTRCITSQLIKWFSNFREFFYIQIEKFARHALVEGAADVRDLTVGRESQLFRALNMHYNKANDFQVPERFLEVTEITLREFYFAISTGKDQDPSWKKAIYKVICKLDGQLPAGFNRDHRK